jgi:2-oxo-4-hydroxy-4-carboxy-5-ureidoimidazoline decarboxylase
LIALAALNALDEAAFTELLGGIFEHSPWVPQAVWPQRPFASTATLHEAMVAVVTNAGEDRQLTLLRAHPELARPAALTAASAAEQGGMGFDRLDGEEAAAFDAANASYRERFGFPFIIAVRGQRDRTAILAALRDRLAHDLAEERQAALAEVFKVAGFRLGDLIDAN